ncbi:replication protein A 32 kDa subunit-like [Salminus brasiliensis]|uniref:replication protein A 32 kDa subunit-like n=1 Tax=Salminus brasiliensis TaxID=930266 RepID=UPI003B83229E
MGSHGYNYKSSPGEASCSPSEGKSKRSRILCILPCTVSQLMSATPHQDAFFIKGIEINQVSVVGVIRRTKPSVAHVVYTLDDMTGPPVDVKQWMNLEDVNMNSCVIPPGTYIKLVGSLRSFQHRRSLVAFSIRRVEDLNEVTSHMLEVVQAHLLNDGSSCSMMKNKSMTSAIMSLSNARESTSYGFTANQSQVFNLIKSCPLAEGISVQSLRTTLKYLSLYDLRASLQFLINEGHIFSTVDEDHFKSTY